MAGEAGETDEKLKGAGAIQTELTGTYTRTMIGDIKQTEIMAGS